MLVNEKYYKDGSPEVLAFKLTHDRYLLFVDKKVDDSIARGELQDLIDFFLVTPSPLLDMALIFLDAVLEEILKTREKINQYIW